MVIHRRGGKNPLGTGRRKRPKQKRTNSNSEENNSSDGGSVTRCVCNETHSIGLMVQCDQCEVWQHCACMGLEEPDIPEQYYCEQCKPESHKMISSSSGRSQRQYINAERAKAPKKRMTLNSREASMSLKDVLAVRSALESYTKEQVDDKENHIFTNSKLSSPLSEKIELSSSVSSIIHDEVAISTEQDAPETPTPNSNYQKTKVKKRLTKPEEDPKKKTLSRGVPNKQQKKAQSKSISHPSTPTRDQSPHLPSDIEDNEIVDTSDTATLLFDCFTSEARESSPPAKIRLPNSRMSMNEMNRRANQILEYISVVQVELANKEIHHAGHGNQADDDDNDSLSSASTIPLNENPDIQNSLEIMDTLTRKLIKFQTRFGPKNRAIDQDILMENEGRVTRSREASGSLPFRNISMH